MNRWAPNHTQTGTVGLIPVLNAKLLANHLLAKLDAGDVLAGRGEIAVVGLALGGLAQVPCGMFSNKTVARPQGVKPMIVGPLAELFGGAPALLLGIEDPLSKAHSPNESLHEGDFQKLTASLAHLFGNLGSLPDGKVK